MKIFGSCSDNCSTTIALTATATDRVRRDIIEQLSLHDPKTFITGFARPNLFYEVQCPKGEKQKEDLLAKFLRETPGSGIIYASTRKRAEEVAAFVAEDAGRTAAVYHAAMLSEDRRKAQEAFMEGRVEVVAATNAFGMGIDKADVRFVVHYNLPGSLEAYYQEAGRAGRDGQPSRCLMLYHASDRFIQEYFIDNAYPSRENVRRVYEFLCELDENPIQMTQQEVKEELRLSIGGEGVGNCEQLLESAGVLERLIASQNMASVRLDSDLPTLVDLLPKQAKVRRRVLQAVEAIVGARRNELVQFHPRELAARADLDANSINAALRELNELGSFTYVPPFRGRAIRMIRRDVPFEQLDIDFAEQEVRKAAELEKLNRVIRFALSGACRQREILQYFGEKEAAACGHCDNCRRGKPRKALPEQAAAAAVSPDDPLLVDRANRAQRGRPHPGAIRLRQDADRANALRLGLRKGEEAEVEPVDDVRTVGAFDAAGGNRADRRLDRGRLLGADRGGPLSARGAVDGPWGRGHARDPSAGRPAGDSRKPVAKASRAAARSGGQAVEATGGFRPGAGRSAGRQPGAISDAIAGACGRRGPAGGLDRKRLAGDWSIFRTSRDAAALSAGQRPRGRGKRRRTLARVGSLHIHELPPRPTAFALLDWRLLAAGFAVAECAAIRGIKPEAALDHALRAVEEGWPLEARQCISPELLAAMEAAIGPDEPEQIRPLLAKLPPGTPREEVELFLRCRRRRTARLRGGE